MLLHFNVRGDQRRVMVKAVENVLGVKAAYQGVPSCAYKIGDFTIYKDGSLEFSTEDTAIIGQVVDACTMVSGNHPEEWDTVQEEIEHEFVVKIPIEKVNVENLKKLLEAKGTLIKKAVQTDTLCVKVDEGNVLFPWFTQNEPDEMLAYTRLISALCEMSVKQKRITAKAKDEENEKYAFRCFLLRLGFIGDQYKEDRKILMKNFEGSSAFKNTCMGGR